MSWPEDRIEPSASGTHPSHDRPDRDSDRGDGTLPDAMPAPAAEHQHEPSRNPIVRHWRGDYSLGVSYWIFGALLSVIATVVFRSLGDSRGSFEWTPMAAGYVIVASYLFLMTMTVWQLVGIYRAAGKHVSRGGRRGWATMARIMVVLGVLRAGLDLVNTGRPLMIEAAGMIAGKDTLAPYELTLLADGTELEVSGGMPFGTAAAVRAELERHPGIRVIHMNSLGGRMHEAFALLELFRARGLSTYTSSSCTSACAIAFLGGRQRYLARGARIGFHTVSFGTLEGDDANSLNRPVVVAMRERHVPADFIDRALRTASDDMWFPTDSELRRANIIHQVVEPSRFARSGLARPADADALREALIEIPALAAMHRYDPDNFERLSELMAAEMRAGTPALSIQHKARIYFTTEIAPGYVARAPDGPLMRYMRSQIAEMQFLLDKDPQLCHDYVLPHLARQPLDAQRVFPAAMLREDIAALAQVIEHAALDPQTSQHTPEIQADLEAVLDKISAYDPMAVPTLQAMNAGEPVAPRPMCEALIHLYGEILNIPDAARSGAVLRFMMS